MFIMKIEVKVYMSYKEIHAKSETEDETETRFEPERFEDEAKVKLVTPKSARTFSLLLYSLFEIKSSIFKYMYKQTSAKKTRINT